MNHNYLKGTKESVKTRLLFFGRNSNIHGLRYIVQDTGNFLTRLFWTAVLVGSGVCLYIILLPLIQRPRDVTFMPNTLYVEWDSKFPAVTVCENSFFFKNVMKRMLELFPDEIEPMDQNLRRYLADIVFGRGTCKFNVCTPSGANVPCDFSWHSIIYKVRLSCEKLITNCRYNNVPFQCCKYFRPADSETGKCFAFNALINWNATVEPFTMNRTTGPAILTFRISSAAMISLHSNEELATFDLPRENQFVVREGYEATYLFSMAEMESDPVFGTESLEVRKCRYPYELQPLSPLHTYKTYSYGACQLAVATENTFGVCGCIHPMRLSSYQDKYCNFTGINCLSEYTVQKKLAGDTNKPSEDCLPSCVETELSAIHLSIKRYESNAPSTSNITIQAINLPTVRFTRTIFHTDLDLVVSLGGMFGLFFGASILSFAETIYLLLRRN